ncbi:MAG: protein-glutamine glutaminase family protein [Bacteriovoracaceae bacterium]
MLRNLFIFLLWLSFSASASTIDTQIHSIQFGDFVPDIPLIYLSGGQILKLSKPDLNLLSKLQESLISKQWLRITLNKKKEIINIEKIKAPFSNHLKIQKSFSIFVPSVIDNFKIAQSYFNESKRPLKESQCYNRAHVWTHDWLIQHNLLSSKIFLFFTQKYIREFNFEWWFHVSPLVHVKNEQGEIKQRVMDIKYAKGPIKTKQWTDIFMKNDSSCPLVSSYSDQANNPESSYCYIMITNMYYYQPQDLEFFELSGVDKSYWIEDELKNAYLEAFNINL